MNDVWGYLVDREAVECTVVLSGELDMAARDALLDVLTAELDRPGVRGVHVDLTAVSFLDSTIMSALVNAYLTAQEGGRSVTIGGATGMVRRSLDTAGLLRLLAPGADSTSGLPGP